MPTEYLIWWLCDEDMKAIGETVSYLHHFPKYLREQYLDRHGRPGNGRLWSADGMPESVKWKRTAMGRRLMDYGGIVIKAEDYELLAKLPGIVTDFTLQRPEIGVVREEYYASHQD